MKISLFYEFPLPRPWTEDDEHKLFQDGLDEVEAADKAGFSTVWLTEHHFLEEYCHSTAPEMFLAAASQRTKDIRLGLRRHASAAAGQPSGPRRRTGLHPGPICPTAASSSVPASGRRWANSAGSASIPPTSARSGKRRSRSSIRCMIEEPFTGFKGQHIEMPARNVDSQAAAEAAPAGVGRLHPARRRCRWRPRRPSAH